MQPLFNCTGVVASLEAITLSTRVLVPSSRECPPAAAALASIVASLGAVCPGACNGEDAAVVVASALANSAGPMYRTVHPDLAYFTFSDIVLALLLATVLAVVILASHVPYIEGGVPSRDKAAPANG